MNETEQANKETDRLDRLLNDTSNKSLKSTTMQTIRKHLLKHTLNAGNRNTQIKGTPNESDILLLKRGERVRSTFIKKRDT